MNKVKMFFIATALVLTTAGVFAAKAKFTIAGIYAYNSSVSSTYFQLDAGAYNTTNLTTSTGTNQVTVSDGTNTFNVFTYDSVNGYKALFPAGSF